ncbi:MAG: glycosyltransferase family 39 protein [Bacteroidota bacterium]|nr:glycosyltransferase family 39 protein [Bacteroidota bacterium]
MKKTNPEDLFYRRTALAIITGFACIRSLIAFSMELGTDEAYYWFYSQNLKWNYYDHPPMVAIWIRTFTANLSLQHIEGFIRLGSVLGGSVASWAVYKILVTIHSAKAGLLGVCLYQASLFASVTAGIFIMPDTPQMVFYTLSLWMLARIIKNEKDWLAWSAFGVAAGLCIMSKVYGGFLWAGVGLFALFKKRSWFLQPHLYVACGVTALLASPILLWNVQNDFLTFRFHSSRVTEVGNSFNSMGFGREVVNQVFYNNPFNVFVIVVALVASIKLGKTKEPRNEALSIFNFIALPQITFFLLLALFGVNTLPHWSGPAYVALMPLAAIYLTGQPTLYTKRLLLAALSTLVLFLAVWQYLIHLAPSLITEKSVDEQIRQEKETTVWNLLDGFASFQLIAPTRSSWKPAGEAFVKLYQQEKASGIMEKGAPVLCYDWGGAQIEYYFCHGANIPMIGLGEPDELHEYLFTNAKRKKAVSLASAYCIVPADNSYDVQTTFAAYYRTITKPSLITVERRGQPDLKFYVYRLHGWKNRLPMVNEKPAMK